MRSSLAWGQQIKLVCCTTPRHHLDQLQDHGRPPPRSDLEGLQSDPERAEDLGGVDAGRSVRAQPPQLSQHRRGSGRRLRHEQLGGPPTGEHRACTLNHEQRPGNATASPTPQRKFCTCSGTDSGPLQYQHAMAVSLVSDHEVLSEDRTDGPTTDHDHVERPGVGLAAGRIGTVQRFIQPVVDVTTQRPW
jgi:hypothetical protein